MIAMRPLGKRRARGSISAIQQLDYPMIMVVTVMLRRCVARDGPATARA